MSRPRIEIGHNRVRRLQGLDDLARLLFRKSSHQKLFLTIFVDLKHAEEGMLPSLSPSAEKAGVSERVLEEIRARMRTLGIIDHISRFSAQYNYHEGWVLSKRFSSSLRKLADKCDEFRDHMGTNQRQKDEDSLRYL